MQCALIEVVPIMHHEFRLRDEEKRCAGEASLRSTHGGRALPSQSTASTG